MLEQNLDEKTNLPYSYVQTFQVLTQNNNSSLVLYFVPPLSITVYQELCRWSNQIINQCIPVSEADFAKLLMNVYQQDSHAAKQMMEEISNDTDLYSLVEDIPEHDDLLNNDEDAPIIKLINAMLSEAVKMRASDVHIETFESNLSIRFRVDGVLREILQPQRKLAPLLISRIKVMAKLDIAEKRIPQDGRIAIKIGGRTIDLRVSTLPSNHAERVVLRLLDKNSVVLNLERLGMHEEQLKKMHQALSSPHGIILVTGPTGSGKSTTLYAALTQINSKMRNILTVEDPIEYDLEGIGQTQVNTKVDMTFSRGLRAILRQDPDVVMIGEIRDSETAKIAVQASLTGHLVLSTLHTNTAIGAITRLQDMGVEPFLLSTSLIAVVAQRLVRNLCPNCKSAYHTDETESLILGVEIGTLVYKPMGCTECQMTGYLGRSGIYEIVMVTEFIRQAIYRSEGENIISQLIRETTNDLRTEGILKVIQGVTSLEEIVRVTRNEI